MTRSGSRVMVFIAGIVLLSLTRLDAQPCFDVAGVSTWYMPGNDDLGSLSEIYGTVFLSLPVDIGKHHKIIFSPWYEVRKLESEKYDSEISLISAAFPVTYRMETRDSAWNFTVTFIPRYNSTHFSIHNNTFQAGGAVLTTYRLKPNLKVKFGVYYNREFFGDFVLPLAGIDWRINHKWNLYGVIPNTMKLEYRVSNVFFTGLTLKSITNSFRYRNKTDHFKIEDNHLCLFADIYLPKKITLMAEAGHSIMRKVRNRSDFFINESNNNSFIFKAGIYYRIRFD